MSPYAVPLSLLLSSHASCARMVDAKDEKHLRR